MSRFIGSRPMSQYDLYQQQRGDAALQAQQESWQYNQARRDALRGNAAASANSVGRDNADRDQQMRMLAMQQSFASQEAQNSRDWELQTAMNPELRRAQMNERNTNANFDADRQANLMRSQGNVNAFVNTERMRDQQGLAVTQAQLDAVATMQKGNIDSRLLDQRGQQDVYRDQRQGAMEQGRDKLRSGLSLNEDAETRMRNREAEVMDRFNQEHQNGLELAPPEQQRRDALMQELSTLKDMQGDTGSKMTPAQIATRRMQVLQKLGQTYATIKPTKWADDVQAKGQFLRVEGGVLTPDQHGNPKFTVIPPLAAGKTNDPKQIELDNKLKLSKHDSDIQTALNKDILATHKALVESKEPGQKIPSLETIEDDLRERRGLPPRDRSKGKAPAGLANPDVIRAQDILNKYGNAPYNGPEQAKIIGWARGVVQMAQQAQGGPIADPRSEATQQAPDPGMPPQRTQQPQRMVPGQPGPITDPRVSQMQGQPAPAPQQQPQRPFVGATPPRPAAPDWTVDPQIKALSEKHVMAAQNLESDPIVQKAIANQHPGVANAVGQLKRLLMEQAKSVATNGQLGDQTKQIAYLTQVLRQMAGSRYEPTRADRMSEYTSPIGQ